MVHAYLQRWRGALLSALGITVLLGTPLLAQADQGKWWTPKQGDQAERHDRNWRGSRDQGTRERWRDRQSSDRGTRVRYRDRQGADRGTWRQGGVRQRERGGVIVRDRVVRDRVSRTRVRGSIGYQSPRFRVGGSWGGYSSWRGVPVRRDVLVIRDHRYGGYFRARRSYCAPRYYGHFVYVRPVRFFISADACIGPIGIRARIVRPHYLYGCNFCDARFEDYGGYCQHVEHCGARPSGFEISVSNWDDSDDWDGPYQTEDGYYDDHGHGDEDCCDDEDGGYYDDER